MAILYTSEHARTEKPEAPEEQEGPSRLERAVRLAFGEREHLRDERLRLADENRRLMSEVERLSEENAALRDAANIWIRLYEKQLERANRATGVPARRLDFRR